MFEKKFEKITGYKYLGRYDNLIEDKCVRKDMNFEKLSRLYLKNPNKINKLIELCLEELELIQHQSMYALLSYSYYFKNELDKSKEYMLKALILNSENIDNWIDMAFIYRHLNNKLISDGILYNYSSLILYYQKNIYKIKNQHHFEMLIIKFLASKSYLKLKEKNYRFINNQTGFFIINSNFKKILDKLFEKDNFNFLSIVLPLFHAKNIGRPCLSLKFIKKILPFLDEFNINYQYIKRSKTKDAFWFEKKNAPNSYNLNDVDVKELKKKNYYLYISYDKELIEKIIKIETSFEYGVIDVGENLGFPDCCVKFYDKKCKEGDVSDVSLIYNIFKDGPAKNTMFNNVARLGRTLLLHFPCSYNCSESLFLALKYFYVVSKINGNYTEKYLKYLKYATFISDTFIINFNEKIPEYNKIITNFHQRSSNGKEVKILDNQTVEIDGEIYKGKMLFFD